MSFDHPLAQNKEKYKGYTVFHLKFDGGLVKMMTLVDVKTIVKKVRKQAQTRAVRGEKDERDKSKINY